MPRAAGGSGGTRQRILDVALQLFAERGYAGTSIRDLAEALDITKAAVYYHFSAKEQIAAALLEPFVRDLDAVAAETEAAAQPVDPRALLRRLHEVIRASGQALAVAFSDPSPAAACASLHDEALRAGERLANALAGPGAGRARLLRAHAAVGAFFSGLRAGDALDPPMTQDDLDDLIEAVVATLGETVATVGESTPSRG